jgi:hypothetical protein
VILQSSLLTSALHTADVSPSWKKKKKKKKSLHIICFFSFVLFRYFLMDKNAQGVFSPQSQNNYNCGFHATCPLLDLRTKSIVVAMPPRALSYIKTSHSENEI